jgi:hypothetical protein
LAIIFLYTVIVMSLAAFWTVLRYYTGQSRHSRGRAASISLCRACSAQGPRWSNSR